jgi:hypothetical protein
MTAPTQGVISRGFAVAMLVGVAGCDALSGLLGLIPGASTVTVRLVNNGDFDVLARLALSDEDDIPEALLEEDDDLEYTVPPAQTRTFSRSCDDLRAVMVTHAELRIIGGIGPEADSGVQRDGDDFTCGDVITFRFEHSDAIVDFAVSVSVE